MSRTQRRNQDSTDDLEVTGYVNLEPYWPGLLRFMDHALATKSVSKAGLANFIESRDEVLAYVSSTTGMQRYPEAAAYLRERAS